MTLFSKSLVVLNGLGAIGSLVLLILTWQAQGIIIRNARQMALTKARAYLDPAIPKAEKLLEQGFVNRKLPETVREKLEIEIKAYRKSPDEWLLALASSNEARVREFEFPEVSHPLTRASLDFVTRRLAGARDHFNNSFANLIRDLRIFTLTNAIAFLVATGLGFAAKTPPWKTCLTIWSAVLLASTLISALVYQEQSFFWNILMNDHMGWSYVGIHLFTSLYLAARIFPTLRNPARI